MVFAVNTTFLMISWISNIFVCVGVFVYFYFNRRQIIKKIAKKQRQRNKNVSEILSIKEEEIKQKEINYKTSCQQREKEYNQFREKKEAEIKEAEESLKKKIEEFENNYALLTEKIKHERQDFEEEKKQVEEDIKSLVADIDKKTGDKIKEIAMSNTLEFKCACSDDLIPCSIDFTKDNTYRCSKCGTVYRVDFRAEPVSIGRSASEEEYLALVERRLDDAKE